MKRAVTDGRTGLLCLTEFMDMKRMALCLSVYLSVCLLFEMAEQLEKEETNRE